MDKRVLHNDERASGRRALTVIFDDFVGNETFRCRLA
jgi:hypothetical protein